MAGTASQPGQLKDPVARLGHGAGRLLLERLPDEIARDGSGFVLTGEDAIGKGRWPLERRPYSLETSMPGVFAAGDARHGSARRVASAVGEGSIAIQLVHASFDSGRLDSGRPAYERAAS